MNYKKIIMVLMCLSSTVVTQAMGGGFFLNLQKLEPVIPLAAAAAFSVQQIRKEEKERKNLTQYLIHNFSKNRPVEIVTLKDGKKVFVSQASGDLAGERMYGDAFNSGPESFGFVDLGRTAFKARAFGQGTHQRNCYEALRDHEISHIGHDDSSINQYKLAKNASIVSASVYTGMRCMFRKSLPISIAGASVGALAVGAEWIAKRNAVEKRADLEGCSTSAKAESMAKVFDAIALDKESGESVPITPRIIKAMKTSSDKELEQWTKIYDKEVFYRKKALKKLEDQDNFLERCWYSFKDFAAENSEIGFAAFHLHPHPRVRAAYLREHAEKLKKEGK